MQGKHFPPEFLLKILCVGEEKKCKKNRQRDVSKQQAEPEASSHIQRLQGTLGYFRVLSVGFVGP